MKVYETAYNVKGRIRKSMFLDYYEFYEVVDKDKLIHFLNDTNVLVDDIEVLRKIIDVPRDEFLGEFNLFKEMA